MPNKYSFLSELEPTDEQLNELMKAVLVDVKIRAILADERFKTLQKTQIQEAKVRYNNRKTIND